MTTCEKFVDKFRKHLLSNGYGKQHRLLDDFEELFGYRPNTLHDYDEEEDGDFQEWLQQNMSNPFRMAKKE